MHLYHRQFNCPYYEECAGEYYQGCWEFTNLCYAGPELGSSSSCQAPFGCPLGFGFFDKENKMLETILSAYEKPIKVNQLWGTPVDRPRSELQKAALDRMLKESIQIFNENNRRFIPYI